MAFRIRKLFHIIHITDGFDALDQWYVDVFGGRHWAPKHYSPIEMRYGSLLCVGDIPIEPMATSDLDGADKTPVGRFSAKIGPHWHSIAWYIEGADDLYAAVTGAGIRVVGDGGLRYGSPGTSAAMYTHPRDTFAQLEFFAGTSPGDPRFDPEWDPTWWASEHPLGLLGLSHATIVVGDLDRAASLFTSTLGARVVGEAESTLTGTKDVFVAMGDESVVALSEPTSAGSLAGEDHARHGDILHAVTFHVGDLGRAEAHLRGSGVDILERDGATIVADPATTFGAVMAFTVRPPAR
jgi:catechol 2,3-dioxygenase-like lactoylglutathione lyase family enzyme